jgi:hypothetical protein
MSAADLLRQNLLDHYTGVAAFAVQTLFLGLFAADPTELGSLASEVTGAGYARQPLAGVMGAADPSGFSVNTSIIAFGPAGADWGTTAFLGIAHTLTGGQVFWPGAMNQPRTITLGQPFQIPIGALFLRIK